MESKLVVELTDGQIKNAVAVAIAEALSPDRRDAILTDVIRTYLSEKKDSYSKETILDGAVRKAVLKMAEEVIEEKMVELSPRIKVIVASTLGPSFQDSVCDSVANGLNNLVMGNLKFDVRIVDY